MSFCLLPIWVFAQKPALKIEDFDQWKSLKNVKLSHNGEHALYLLSPLKGDNDLVWYRLKSDEADTFKTVSRAEFSGDNQFLVATVAPTHEEVRKAKLAKTKKEDMPKDSLFFKQLSTGTATGVAGVANWKVPKGRSSWLAYQKHFVAILDTLADSLAKKKPKAKPKKDAGKTLVIRNMRGGDEFEFPQVKKYGFSENGTLCFFSSKGDSVFDAGLYVFNTQKEKLIQLKEGKHKLASFALDTNGINVAMVVSFHEKKDDKHYKLTEWSEKAGYKELLDSQKLKLRWRVSEHRNASYTEDGKRILFGTAIAPKDWPEDSTILEEEKAKVDVWSYHDKRIQPEQKKNLDKDKKKSYLAVWDRKKKSWIQIEDEKLSNARIAGRSKGDYALAYDNTPYQKERSWEYPWTQDIHLIDLKRNAKRLLIKKSPGGAGISPSGRFVLWFNKETGDWYSIDTRSLKRVNLTSGVKTSFQNEDDDHPALAGSYRSGGWVEGDKYLFLYDKYDIWRVTPDGRSSPTRLTRGRENQKRYRLVRQNREKQYWEATSKMMVSGFDFVTKSTSTSFLTCGGDWSLRHGEWHEENRYFRLQSRNGKTNLFKHESSTAFGDLYANGKRISNANPQQSTYNWYTTELVSYTSLDGKKLSGILYLPENLDASKKYPMITYFYERLSDYYHEYQAPRPSRSTISRSFYASNGYIVFVPDIVYEDGRPGPSAYNCIMPGVSKLLAKRSYIDKSRLALQGQSWGGYQTAYLITQTNLFACAMAGAPVSNMTSAYGGIRWGSGMNRAFQYEHAQSRIGGSLWELPRNYIENSPVFYADRVETPLLIMHNDNDGAVPWYQGIEYFMALRRLDKRVWMLVYNGEEHNLTKWPNRVDLSHRMFQFFNHYLKDESPPEWMEKGIPAMEKEHNKGY